jgi:phosphinothricin acetyltransferase
MDLTPYRLGPGDVTLKDVLTLIQTTFADMEGRIAPPSSMHWLTLESVTKQAETGEIWGLGDPVQACVFLTQKPYSLYLGKLADARDAQRQGLARRLIALARSRAEDLGLPYVELQTRIELVENQATFEALGFQEIDRTAHPGYDRPTSITYRLSL